MEYSPEMSAKCPQCQKECSLNTSSDLNKYFPFCSERCQLIDFGGWANGSYRIAGEVLPENEIAEHRARNGEEESQDLLERE